MASTLRRGFKSEANEMAREMRRELGLPLEGPLDPWRLADHLAIPIVTLSDLRTDATDAEHFLSRESAAFSAVTVFRQRRRMIVHNDGHAPGRQSNNIAHELSHALLHHTPAPALSGVGCRNWDGVLEEEANWLGAALLISEEAALRIVREGLTLPQAAAIFGVSEPLVRMRINVTGARNRVDVAVRVVKTRIGLSSV